MKPEAVFFCLVLAAPIACLLFSRTVLVRVVASGVASIVLMSLCLAVGESRASVPDYDIVFGLSLLLWNTGALIYAVVVSLALTAIKKFLMRLFGRKDPGEL
jgi:hypothetical protein